MINTHEKLMDSILKEKLQKKQIFTLFKMKGYKGTEEKLITDLLFVIGATDGYINSPQFHLDGSRDVTEKEYFEILVKEMNINY